MKGKCQEKQLTAFLFGELAADEAEMMQKHIDECSECQAELASLKEIVESYPINEKIPDVELISLTVSRIQETVSKPQSRFTPFFAWPRLSWVPAAVILLSAFIFFARLNKPVYQDDLLTTKLLNLENEIETMLDPKQTSLFFLEEESSKVEMDKLELEINELTSELENI